MDIFHSIFSSIRNKNLQSSYRLRLKSKAFPFSSLLWMHPSKRSTFMQFKLWGCCLRFVVVILSSPDVWICPRWLLPVEEIFLLFFSHFLSIYYSIFSAMVNKTTMAFHFPFRKYSYWWWVIWKCRFDGGNSSVKSFQAVALWIIEKFLSIWIESGISSVNFFQAKRLVGKIRRFSPLPQKKSQFTWNC